MTAPDRDPLSLSDESLPDDAAEAWQIEAQLPRLRSAGQHDLAAALGERLLEIREATLGPADDETLLVVEALAESYFQISRYERAEALLQRVLGAREIQAAPDAVAMGDVLAQLAKVHRVQGALDRAEALYRRALTAYEGAPERSSVGVATAFHGLAHVLLERGEIAEGEAMCRAALELREKLGDDALVVAESLNSLAIFQRKKGDLAEAERLYLRALAVHEAIEGRDHPNLATTLINLGVLYTEQEAHEKTGAVLRRAAAILEAREGPPDTQLASVLEALSTHHASVGEDAAAIEAARRSVALYEELLGPSHPKLALSLNNLAVKLPITEAARPEAEALFRRAIGLSGELGAGANVSRILLNLAALRIADGDLDEGEELTKRAHDLARSRHGADHPDTAETLVALSQVAERREDLPRAIELMTAAFAIHGKRSMLDPIISDMTRMGELMLAAEAPDEAATCLRDALELAAGSRGREHPSVAHLIFLAGKVAMAQKEPKQALFCFNKALAIDEKAKGTTHLDLLTLLNLSAEANLALGKLGAAETNYKRMGEIYAKNHPPDSEWQAIVPMLLGDVATKRKQHKKAAELFEQALALAEGVFGTDDLSLQVVLDKAGEAQLQCGALARAEELSRRLLEMYERELPSDHPALLPAVRRLATIYVETGDPRREEMLKRTIGSLEATTRELNAETARIKADLARRKGQS